MRCEVCGRRIRGEPKKVMIERAKMIVCEECAKLGSVYIEPEITQPRAAYTAVKKTKMFPTEAPTRKETSTSLHEETELVENFGSIIREAREKMGLSHEDLGKKIGEKISVLKKIESKKVSPDKKLATKLEHMLKVKLFVQVEEPRVPEKVSSPPSSMLTLGEIAHLKTEGRRKPENEGSNRS